MAKKTKKGRIKGRVYPDMLSRGLLKTYTRLASALEAMATYNKQAKDFEHPTINKKLIAKLTSAAKLIEDASDKIGVVEL